MRKVAGPPVFEFVVPGDGDELPDTGVGVTVDGDDKLGVVDADAVGVPVGVGVAPPGGKKLVTVICLPLEAIALIVPLAARPIST